MWQGLLVSIHLASEATRPAVSLQEARALPGLGLEGDRYALKTGTFSKSAKPGREVTLIEIEALEALKRDLGMELTPGETRRNLVTRGVPLNHLVGAEFRVGEILLRGVRLCEPCGHLEKLTGPGMEQALLHRGGLRAQILSGGILRVGDAVTPAAAP